MKVIASSPRALDISTGISTNATFTSPKRSAKRLADEIEEQLRSRFDLDVRVCVRTEAQIQQALDELPALNGYVLVNVLFDKPTPSALKAVLEKDWSPEKVLGNDQVLYLAYQQVNGSKL